MVPRNEKQSQEFRKRLDPRTLFRFLDPAKPEAVYPWIFQLHVLTNPLSASHHFGFDFQSLATMWVLRDRRIHGEDEIIPIKFFAHDVWQARAQHAPADAAIMEMMTVCGQHCVSGAGLHTCLQSPPPASRDHVMFSNLLPCPALLSPPMTDHWGAWWILTLAPALWGALTVKCWKPASAPVCFLPARLPTAALPSLPLGCGSTANRLRASVCCGKIPSSKRPASGSNPCRSWPHAASRGLAAAQPHPASSDSSCALHPFVFCLLFSFLTCQGLCLQTRNGAWKMACNSSTDSPTSCSLLP